MTTLPEIAASVARALDLQRISPATASSEIDIRTGWRSEDGEWLWIDGSNLFDAYWQVRCRDWLLENGYLIALHPKPAAHVSFKDGHGDYRYYGPASEFCARAIHEVMISSQNLLEDKNDNVIELKK